MKSLRKRAFYDDLAFEISEEVYEPAEDTFLIADVVKRVVKEGDMVLDIGTGCGLLAVVAAKIAAEVVATDVNPHALRCAKLNAETNGVALNIKMCLGGLFQPMRRTEQFDAIIFNAPYLPSSPDEQETWLGQAWAGGSTGRHLIDEFIVESQNYLKQKGRILLVQSSLANISTTLEKFHGKGLEAEVVAEKKADFETIVVIQANHLSK